MGSLPPPVEAGEEVAKPRKLGRLRKAGPVENAPPNRTAAPASPGQLGGKPAQGAVDGDQEAPESPAVPEEEAAAAGDSAAAASPSRLASLLQWLSVRPILPARRAPACASLAFSHFHRCLQHVSVHLYAAHPSARDRRRRLTTATVKASSSRSLRRKRRTRRTGSTATMTRRTSWSSASCGAPRRVL